MLGRAPTTLSRLLGTCAVALAASAGFQLTPGPAVAAPADGSITTVAHNPHNGDVFYACFAEGTSDEYIQSWYEQGALKPGVAPESGYEYFVSSSWNGTGQPINLTWSFVPDGLSFPVSVSGSGNSSLFSDMTADFAGDQAEWIFRFEQAFSRWDALTGITFTRITFGGNEWDDGAGWNSSGNANRGNIRIGARQIDGSNNVLAFANFPGTGSGGNIVMDRAENWSQGGAPYTFLRNVVQHETGHSLGMSHVCPTNQTKLMEPTASTAYRGPRHDDVRAGQRQHGDIYENNDTSGAAAHIGTVLPTADLEPCVPPGTSLDVENDFGSTCGIEINGENDWYTFDITEASDVTITVDPIGLTYGNNTQNTFTGNCNTGNQVDSLNIADLELQLVDTNGSTVLASSTGNGLGESESILDFNLPAAGTYYIRVWEDNGPGQVQLYNLIVSAETAVGEVCQTDLGFQGPGSVDFSVCGQDLATGNTATHVLTGAPAFASASMVFGLANNPVPFKGGQLVPTPILTIFTISTDGNGEIIFPIPGGGGPATLYVQWIVADGTQPFGFALSNALEVSLLP